MKKKPTTKKTATKKKGKKSRGRGKDQLKADVASIAEILSIVALDGGDSDEHTQEIIEGWSARLGAIRDRWRQGKPTDEPEPEPD